MQGRDAQRMSSRLGNPALQRTDTGEHTAKENGFVT